MNPHEHGRAPGLAIGFSSSNPEKPPLGRTSKDRAITTSAERADPRSGVPIGGSPPGSRARATSGRPTSRPSGRANAGSRSGPRNSRIRPEKSWITSTKIQRHWSLIEDEKAVEP